MVPAFYSQDVCLAGHCTSNSRSTEASFCATDRHICTPISTPSGPRRIERASIYEEAVSVVSVQSKPIRKSTSATEERRVGKRHLLVSTPRRRRLEGKATSSQYQFLPSHSQAFLLCHKTFVMSHYPNSPEICPSSPPLPLPSLLRPSRNKIARYTCRKVSVSPEQSDRLFLLLLPLMQGVTITGCDGG